MKESHSKFLLIIESLLCLAPLTLLTAWYASFLVSLYQHGLANEPLSRQIAPAFTFLGLTIQALGWWAIGVFLSRGRKGIVNLSKVSVIAMSLGALLAILGGLALSLMFVFGDSSALAFLSINAFGLPALVPFAHLAVERGRASASSI
ncbi:MAG: hypothetical protein EOP50_09450 [Sphingobacteriales bacterium]|nr:MAG: hypothetical protein EOP50_09450 [Sphingobacteriales bacterium]